MNSHRRPGELGKLENDMNASIEFIKAIASNFAETRVELADIKNVLEDGAALADLGATDDDQEMVEIAHSMVCEWIADGKQFLGQCQL